MLADDWLPSHVWRFTFLGILTEVCAATCSISTSPQEWSCKYVQLFTANLVTSLWRGGRWLIVSGKLQTGEAGGSWFKVGVANGKYLTFQFEGFRGLWFNLLRFIENCHLSHFLYIFIQSMTHTAESSALDDWIWKQIKITWGSHQV